MRQRMVILMILLVSALVVSDAFAEGVREDSGAEGKKVKLRIMMWTNPPTVAAIEELNRKFQAEHPDITVELTHSPTAIYEQQERQARVTAGDVDIVALQALVGSPREYAYGQANKPYWQQWIEAGLLEPLDNRPFLKNYKPEALAHASTYNGNIYTVTTGVVVFSGVFYNKELFAERNLPVPTTWKEFINVCEVFSSSGIAPLTMAGQDVWPVILPMQGILGALYPDIEVLARGIWTGDIKFTDPKPVLALRRMKRILDYCEEGFQGIDYITVAGRFAAGKIPMLPDGIWQAGTIAEANPGLEFGYFPLPASDDAKDNAYLHGKYDLAWAVLSGTKNKETAMRWLTFFSDKQNYNAFINTVGWIPTQSGIQVRDDFLRELAEIPIKPAWDQVRTGKVGAGQYAEFDIFNPRHLSPLGEIETAEGLARLIQADWDAVQ